MLYFVYASSKRERLVNVSTLDNETHGLDWTKVVSRSDLHTFEDAKVLALQANEFALDTKSVERYITVDAGPCTYPRYDVIELPRLGEKVSRSFNGDSYPAGIITKISASFKRIETSDGTVFYRRRLSGAWVNDRTWFMIPGHVRELNPSF